LGSASPHPQNSRGTNQGWPTFPPPPRSRSRSAGISRRLELAQTARSPIAASRMSRRDRGGSAPTGTADMLRGLGSELGGTVRPFQQPPNPPAWGAKRIVASSREVFPAPDSLITLRAEQLAGHPKRSRLVIGLGAGWRPSIEADVSARHVQMGSA